MDHRAESNAEDLVAMQHEPNEDLECEFTVNAAPVCPVALTCDIERLFRLSPDLICVLDFDGHFKQTNPAFHRALALAPSVLASQTFLDLIHPDDRPHAQGALRSLAEHYGSQSFEIRCRRADGTYRWLSCKASAEPEQKLVFTLARDVTEQKLVEEQLRAQNARLDAVVNSALDGLITIDTKGNIESFNPAAERIFGWKADEVIGKNVTVLMPEPYHHEHDGYMQNYLQTGIKRIIGIGREVLGLRKDGSTFPMDLAVTEVRLPERLSFLGIIRDISERKKAEGMRAALLARDAHQRGSIETAAGILHDLGNALTGVCARAVDAQGIIQRSTSSDDMIRKTATFLRANAASLEGAIGVARTKALIELMDAVANNNAKTRTDTLESLSKLLAFASHAQELLTTHRRYSGAESAPRLERMNLRHLLFDAQTMLSDAVHKRQGTMMIECDPRVPPIRVERSKLMQVLVNLVKNSVESFDDTDLQRSPEIILRARFDLSTGCVIEVNDNGPGFNPSLSEQLFVDGYTTKNRGSGFGLGATRRVIESLGGKLELLSKGIGQGAQARIHLPKEMFGHDDT